MNVLITGATGLLGGYLLQELQQRGEQIRALVLPVENAEKLIAQGYEPKVDIREGIRLAAAWFNAGGMEQPFVTQASQYASFRGALKS
jgi:uncharacterized protein YbjT (DUF2867 family)